MKRIAVLMTCYNRVNTTLDCLQRLFAQELPEGFSFDVWLVDDASPDHTGEVVKLKYPTVNVIQSEGGLFWTKGMRLAWDEAARAKEYNFYLWLNDDVLLFNGALSSLISDYNLMAGKEPGVVVGTCSRDSRGETLEYGSYLGSVMRPSGKPVRVPNEYSMSGNVVLIPHLVFRAIGPIFGGYSHAKGDSDYQKMLDRHGIPRYCSSRISGMCPVQHDRYLHLDGKPFGERMRVLFHPKGLALWDTVLYRYRHWGIVRSIISGVHLVMRATLFYKGH